MKKSLVLLALLIILPGLAGCRMGAANPEEQELKTVLPNGGYSPYGQDNQETRLAKFDARTKSHNADLPELDSRSTLDDYLHYAALNNPMLKARFAQFKAAVAQVPQANTLPDPELNFEYTVDSGNISLGVMQMFPWFGTIQARTDAAAARAQAAGWDFEAAKLALFERVGNAYAEYVHLARSIEIARENQTLLTEFERGAIAMYEAGRANYADVVRAQLELAILEDTVSGLEQFRPALAARLNAALHRPPEADLPWPQSVMPDMTPLETQAVLDELKEQNPDLAARQRRIHAAEKEIDLAQKRALPNFGVGLEWMHAGSGGMGNGDDIMLMFTMTLPLWRDSYRAAERQAQAIAGSEHNAKIDAENQLLAQARTAIFNLTDSQRKLKLYREVLLAKARQLIEAAEAAYQEDTMDFLGLIDAHRQLLRYQLEDARAAADNLQARARLAQLTGGLVLVNSKENDGDLNP